MSDEFFPERNEILWADLVYQVYILCLDTLSMMEEKEATLGFGRLVGRSIGTLGRKVEFVYLYSETSKQKLSSWPTVSATESTPAIWADLDQCRILNLHLEAVLFLWSFPWPFIHSFNHLSSHPFHLRIHSFKKHSFNTYVQELELGTFDIEKKATIPPSQSNRRARGHRQMGDECREWHCAKSKHSARWGTEEAHLTQAWK